MHTVDELVMEARRNYEKALELLDRKDYYDSAEKAWKAIECLRKAILVAAKVPYEKAKTVNIGLPLFSDLLRGLGEKHALDLYDKLAYKLHIMGFYEDVVQPEEIQELVLIDTKKLLEILERILEKARRIDLREALKKLDKIQKIKRDIAQHNAKLAEVRTKYRNVLSTALKSIT